MANSRYDFFEKVWNDDIQHNQAGLLSNKDLRDKLLTYDYALYTIPLGEQFRPDIIANKFYGDGKLYWVLVYANDIKDSPAGFTTNKVIRVPSPSIIGGLV